MVYESSNFGKFARFFSGLPILIRNRFSSTSEIMIFSVMTISFAFLRGVRLPNGWSYTQFQIDYSLGFVKRGLAGSLAELLHIHTEKYHVFAIISFLLLLTVYSLLINTLMAFYRSESFFRAGIFFLSSYAMTYLVNLVGYIDIILFLIAIICVRLPTNNLGLLIACPLCISGALFHEAFLLMFMPTIMYRLFLNGYIYFPDRKQVFWRLLLLAAPVLAAVLFSALFRPLSYDQTMLLKASIQNKIGFMVGEEFFEIFNRSAKDNFQHMMDVMKTPWWWVKQVYSLLSLSWIGLYFIWQTIRILQHRGVTGIAVRLAALACFFCPLLLQFMGEDLFRWYVIADLSSFLVFLITFIQFGDSAEYAVWMPKKLLIIFIIISLTSGVGFLDNFHVRSFPFLDLAVIGKFLLTWELPLPNT